MSMRTASLVSWFDSRELTFNTSSLVEDLKVFINGDLTPVRDVNVSGNLGEFGKRPWVSVENL